MVPDVTFVNFVSRNAVDVAEYGGKPKSFDFDVKGCGFLEHLYSPRAGRGVPMQRRADSVRKEWTRKAAEADRAYTFQIILAIGCHATYVVYLKRAEKRSVKWSRQGAHRRQLDRFIGS